LRIIKTRRLDSPSTIEEIEKFLMNAKNGVYQDEISSTQSTTNCQFIDENGISITYTIWN